VNDLLNALLDLASAVKQLSDNYKSTEKLNAPRPTTSRSSSTG